MIVGPPCLRDCCKDHGGAPVTAYVVERDGQVGHLQALRV